MEFRFIKQRMEGAITTQDEIELVNCGSEEGYENGEYLVADVEEDGSITIVGKGALSGYIAVINVS